MIKKATTLFMLFVVFSAYAMMTASLKLTIRDELGNLVVEAEVSLYASADDYEASKNPVFTGKTNEKGILKIKGLEQNKYWVDVVKGDKNNYNAGVEVDVKDGKTNLATIIIE